MTPDYILPAREGYIVKQQQQAYIAGATEQKAIDIEKACEWLEKYMEGLGYEWHSTMQFGSGWKWVRRQVIKGVPRKVIIEEFNENMQLGMQGFCSREGKPLTAAILSKWIKQMGLK